MIDLLLKLKKVLLFDATIEDPENKVRKQIWEDNRRFAIIWSFAQMFYWGFCVFMSFREERFTICRNVYITAAVLSSIAFVLALFFVNKVPRLLLLARVIINAALLGGGLFIAWLLLQNDYKTITVFASVLIAPTFFVKNTLSNIVMVSLHIIAAVILLSFGLTQEDYIQCVTDLIIFSSIGVTLAHFINKARFERYVFAESAVRLAESNARLAEMQAEYAYCDQMTGLRNRRAYSEKIAELTANMPETCSAVIADINGLKEMNDTLGHEAGDELIIGSSQCLRSGFEGIDSIYRLGGDEFCVIYNGTESEMKSCLERVDESCADWNGQFVHGISLSYGFATSEEFDDIKTILREADKRMYLAKGNYYLSIGKKTR